MGEKKVKYAIRKLSQGVFSVVIGTALIYGIPSTNIYSDTINNINNFQDISIKDKIKIEFIPKFYSDLDNNEKTKVTKNISDVPTFQNQRYYLVYEKNNDIVLPKTNEVGSTFNYLYIGSGIVLGSWILLSRKAKRTKFLFSILFLNSFTGVQALALPQETSNSLSKYEKVIEIPRGSKIPNIDTSILGYIFLGFLPIDLVEHMKDEKEEIVANNTNSIDVMSNNNIFSKEETATEAIPYTTRAIDNPDLEEGTTRVQTAGENGIRTIVYRVTYDASGNEIGREEVSSTITKAAVEEVIERGTKPKVTTTEREERVTEAIPYTTRTIDNPDLEEGTTRVQTAGENGIRTIVYRVTYDASGNEIGREEVSSTITKAAVEEVIERGTKPKVTTTEREERVTEAIPYTTRTIDNPDLEEGTTR
ncbi:hypothetical protein IGJ91_002940, partial [Enterococcus sp. DIV0765f]|uniref:G5 domain-containing protein n=1 Tax=Enterococcus sp. DIV0765f TaxID=2774783 RepID=UPI003F20FC5F